MGSEVGKYVNIGDEASRDGQKVADTLSSCISEAYESTQSESGIFVQIGGHKTVCIPQAGKDENGNYIFEDQVVVDPSHIDD